ncbi:MAG: VOC family protein [Gammaproteobacteria bacterium]|jgi:glyoxylase I family protein
MRVTAFNHISLLVSDTARALAFYRDVLGLPPSAERPSLGYAGAWLELGRGQQIHLLELDGAGRGVPDRHGGRDYHLALDVADLDAAVAALHDAGVDFTLSRSGRRALFCRDPDGNAIELVERD